MKPIRSSQYEREPRLTGEQPSVEPAGAQTIERAWRPMLRLTGSDSSAVLSRGSLHVMAELGSADDTAESRPWFAILAPAGMRHNIVTQIGRPELTATVPTDVADSARTPQWVALIEAVAGWNGLAPIDRLRTVAVLNQLTLQRAVPGLTANGVDPAAQSPVEQHLAYEFARAVNRIRPGNALAERAFAVVAGSRTSALQVLARAKLISHGIRQAGDVPGAQQWQLDGDPYSLLAGDSPDWLAHLVASRYHRAVALIHHRLRDSGAAAAAMGSAAEEDAALRQCAGPEHSVTFALWAENHKILLESSVKSMLPTARPDAVAEAQRLAAHDPYCPTSHLLLGDAWTAVDDLERAGEAYLAGAAQGTLVGALAAFRAAACYMELGDFDRAGRAAQLLRSLDYAAVDIDHQLERFRSAGLTASGVSR